jgi:hypothetical protein
MEMGSAAVVCCFACGTIDPELEKTWMMDKKSASIA